MPGEESDILAVPFPADDAGPRPVANAGPIPADDAVQQITSMTVGSVHPLQTSLENDTSINRDYKASSRNLRSSLEEYPTSYENIIRIATSAGEAAARRVGMDAGIFGGILGGLGSSIALILIYKNAGE